MRKKFSYPEPEKSSRVAAKEMKGMLAGPNTELAPFTASEQAGPTTPITSSSSSTCYSRGKEGVRVSTGSSGRLRTASCLIVIA